MNLPKPGDYIDIHNHQSDARLNVFSVENLMAHEGRDPDAEQLTAFTAGIHPWYLNENNRIQLLTYIKKLSSHPDLIAIGEAGFDKIRGPAEDLQRSVFEEQIKIADSNQKPVVIHSVRSWNELLSVHKALKPLKSWLIHGFRGKRELASQLLGRGMYISLWFDFVLRPESADLIRYIPRQKIFLETDGSGADIRDIYGKVSADLSINVEELKELIYNNFMTLFGENMVNGKSHRGK